MGNDKIVSGKDIVSISNTISKVLGMNSDGKIMRTDIICFHLSTDIVQNNQPTS